MRQIQGLDISNWNGAMNQPQLDCWRENGIRHVVVRGSLETQSKIDIANEQLDALEGAGFETSLYLWMYLSWNPIGTVDAGLRQFGHHPLAMWALDCEEQSDIGSPAQNVAWIRSAVAALEGAGKLAVAYTGRWWWMPYTDNAAVAVPLWTADYDHNPDMTVVHPYGAFSAVIGKQWEVGEFCGTKEIDRDTFDADLLYPQPVPSYPLEQYHADAGNAVTRMKLAKAEVDAAMANVNPSPGADQAEYLTNSSNARRRIDRAVDELRQASANIFYG